MSQTKTEFASMDEIKALVSAFETCAITPGEFGHREHLAVALNYLSTCEFDQAADSMRSGLKNLLSHFQIDGYHETITRFWLKRLRGSIRTCGANSLDVRAINRILLMNADSKLIFTFYSRDRLMSETAKREWVEPDLQPMGD